MPKVVLELLKSIMVKCKKVQKKEAKSRNRTRVAKVLALNLPSVYNIARGPHVSGGRGN
jgi:hypothetical protein